MLEVEINDTEYTDQYKMVVTEENEIEEKGSENQFNIEGKTYTSYGLRSSDVISATPEFL